MITERNRRTTNGSEARYRAVEGEQDLQSNPLNSENSWKLPERPLRQRIPAGVFVQGRGGQGHSSQASAVVPHLRNDHQEVSG